MLVPRLCRLLPPSGGHIISSSIAKNVFEGVIRFGNILTILSNDDAKFALYNEKLSVHDGDMNPEPVTNLIVEPLCFLIDRNIFVRPGKCSCHISCQNHVLEAENEGTQ